MRVRCQRFDAASDEAAVSACHEMLLAGRPEDDPAGPPMSARAFGGWLALGWTEDHPQTWLARDQAGEPCGWYALDLPRRENRHLASLSPLVRPGRRRRGAGTALLRHAAARAAEDGRTRLAGDAREGSPGEAFARALGAERGVTEVRRVLRLSGVAPGRLAELRSRAASAARGYALTTWEGPAPPDLTAQVAALAEAMADAPRDAGTESQRWDTARVRESDGRVAAQGLRFYSVAARCERTGEVAGLTQLAVDPLADEWGFQELTAVTRPHRGRRLGLLVKAAMLELLAEREPQLASIITGNAEANEHMIAINAELGYEVLDRWLSWQLDVEPALARG